MTEDIRKRLVADICKVLDEAYEDGYKTAAKEISKQLYTVLIDTHDKLARLTKQNTNR